MYDLVIRSKNVVAPHGVIAADIGISNGKIAALGGDLHGQTVIDAAEMIVLPGAIDVHTHMELPVSRTRSSDDFFTGTRAAAHGGVTTIIDFTTHRRGMTIPQAITARREQASKAVIDYGLRAEVIGWEPESGDQFVEALEMGAISFKFFTTYYESGRMTDDGVLYLAFQELARCGGVAMIHCENDAIIRALINRLSVEDSLAMSHYPRSRPPVTEGEAITRVAYLARQTGVKIYIAHISSRIGLEALISARQQGTLILGETCPHYLFLDESLFTRPDGHLFSVAPPLRTGNDQNRLWAGLATGELAVVSTDHCPFMQTQKDPFRNDLTQIPYGLPGVETRLSLLYSEGVRKGRIDLIRLAEITATNPARIFGLYPRKGALMVGADADIVIFDPRKQVELQTNNLHMQTDFSPYADIMVTGWPQTVLSRGEVIVSDGRFSGARGRGEFIHANAVEWKNLF